MPRQAITPEDLLYQWKIRQSAYSFQVSRMDPNPATPEDTARLTVTIAMHTQLTKCIEELEAVLGGDYPKTDLLNMIINGIRNDEANS